MQISSFGQGEVSDNLCRLCNRHLEMSMLGNDDVRRIEHYKNFGQSLIESLALFSDGSLFSTVRVASSFPWDVIEMVSKSKKWMHRIKTEAYISVDAMLKWPKILERTRVAAGSRNYKGEDADVLQYFKYYVRELVEELQVGFPDGGIEHVLGIASAYPLSIQEMACTKFKGQVMQKTRLSSITMGQWECVVNAGRLAFLDPGSRSYIRSSVAGGQILKDVLKQTPGVEEFPYVIQKFPADAVYMALVRGSVSFLKEFKCIGATHSQRRKIMREWTREVRPEFEKLYAQAGLVNYLRWVDTTHSNRRFVAVEHLTVQQYLASKKKGNGGSKKNKGGMKAVNYSHILLFDSGYHKACKLHRIQKTREAKLAGNHPLYIRIKSAIMWQVVRLVVVYKQAAISVITDEVVSKVRTSVTAAYSSLKKGTKKDKLALRFLEITTDIDLGFALIRDRFKADIKEISSLLLR